ncbi:hypothetical protein CcaverHIS002_0602190 [Cutaneotrichosporon cavernicola]|uniref:Uncharacterized protein n=1 Tax=Cutaneotrichosporon cavernicola TaxID=279322 RepID=A0AA48L879_9TREE|nr:uncharacterized protein CcaverHIS019_0601690 [Cutaneotrichosporon cavernicola]BEI85932.1 hypothetical protein CcaverHIS002_0602190 [Cutaneotrichosporon cavernicola]BEI93710.1 hypothetical protein CcaverHIS019_0601690 [Cutaneotrichosporon cavernicola]BEJ01487.1 hypothetical protein CcaverHIS631_0601690 [Cutaneotrichosporon cavernicola]BEJ09252.1 hypothetical protein CcaverHIS641_0601670 [Cutaneotrichosporon cavernicola]
MGRYEAHSDRHPPPYARPKPKPSQSKDENEPHPVQSPPQPVEQGMPKAKHSDLYTFAPFASAERANSIPPRGPTSSAQPPLPNLASSPVGDPLSTSTPFSAPVAHLNTTRGVPTVIIPMISPSTSLPMLSQPMPPPALSPPVHSSPHERSFQDTHFWSLLSPPVVLRPPAIPPPALRPPAMPQPTLSALPPPATPQPAFHPPTFSTQSSFYPPLAPLAASQRPPSTSYAHSAFMKSQPVQNALSSPIALSPPGPSSSALSPPPLSPPGLSQPGLPLGPTPSLWTAPPSLPGPTLALSMFSRALSPTIALSHQPGISSRGTGTTLPPLPPVPSPAPCPQPALSAGALGQRGKKSRCEDNDIDARCVELVQRERGATGELDD